MNVLFPSYNQIQKHASAASISSQERVTPFKVKAEHMTSCQYIKDSSSLNKTTGTMSKQIRASCSPITKVKEPRPGPADYATV